MVGSLKIKLISLNRSFIKIHVCFIDEKVIGNPGEINESLINLIKKLINNYIKNQKILETNFAKIDPHDHVLDIGMAMK